MTTHVIVSAEEGRPSKRARLWSSHEFKGCMERLRLKFEADVAVMARLKTSEPGVEVFAEVYELRMAGSHASMINAFLSFSSFAPAPEQGSRKNAVVDVDLSQYPADVVASVVGLVYGCKSMAALTDLDHKVHMFRLADYTGLTAIMPTLVGSINDEGVDRLASLPPSTCISLLNATLRIETLTALTAPGEPADDDGWWFQNVAVVLSERMARHIQYAWVSGVFQPRWWESDDLVKMDFLNLELEALLRVLDCREWTWCGESVLVTHPDEVTLCLLDAWYVAQGDLHLVATGQPRTVHESEWNLIKEQFSSRCVSPSTLANSRLIEDLIQHGLSQTKTTPVDFLKEMLTRPGYERTFPFVLNRHSFDLLLNVSHMLSMAEELDCKLKACSYKDGDNVPLVFEQWSVFKSLDGAMDIMIMINNSNNGLGLWVHAMKVPKSSPVLRFECKALGVGSGKFKCSSSFSHEYKSAGQGFGYTTLIPFADLRKAFPKWKTDENLTTSPISIRVSWERVSALRWK